MSSTDRSARDDGAKRPLFKQPFLWAGLSLAMSLVWYQLAFRTSTSVLVVLPFEFLNRPRSDLPWLIALAAAVVACALLMVPALGRRLAPSAHRAPDAPGAPERVQTAAETMPDRIGIAAATVCSTGTALMYLAPFSTVLSYCGGAVAGAGFALLAVRLTAPPCWPRNVKRLFEAGCVALVAAQAAQLVLLVVPVALARVALCLTPFAAVGLLHRARLTVPAAAEPTPVCAKPQEYQLRSHITVIALCFLGLGVYMGIIGFANDELSAADYLSWQFATVIPGCVIACVVLWLSARTSVEGPYVASPVMLGSAALVLLLTVVFAANTGTDGMGEVLAHATGRATDGFLFVTAACTMVELAHAGSPRRLRSPAAMLGLSALALLAGIVVGGVMMSVVGLSVLSITLVAVFLLYGALLSLGLSVQQRSRESYVVVRSSLDVEKIAGAQARILGEELGTLTAREAEVLPYLLQHLSVDAIAERLGVSRNTVKSHVSHIYEKAGVNSRQQLIDLAATKVINL